MITVSEALKIIDKIAPFSTQATWDNSGLQIGRTSAKINTAIFALDLTKEAVEQAKGVEAELIVTHHPAIFHKPSSITDGHWQHELLLECAENNIAVISVHTNWDACKGGVNDVLAISLGLKNLKPLDKETKLGRVGEVPVTSLEKFAEKIKTTLNLSALTVIDAGKKVHKVAVCGGTGIDYLDEAFAFGCDTFLTSDIRYHEAQQGAFGGMNLIDGTHQATEELSLDNLRKQFAKLSKLETYLAKETRIMQVM